MLIVLGRALVLCFLFWTSSRYATFGRCEIVITPMEALGNVRPADFDKFKWNGGKRLKFLPLFAVLNKALNFDWNFEFTLLLH
jgi:hypothetical protein